MAAPLVPSEYGYVVLTTASTFFLGFWHGVRIGFFRRNAGVAYPKPIATDQDIAAADSADKKKALYLFNCAQRAHGNFLENHGSVALALMVGGLQYPLAVSAMGVGWMFFRVLYAVGYTDPSKEDGKGRLRGTPMWLFQLGIFGTMAWTGVKMVGWA